MGPLPDSTTRKTVPLRQLASLLVLHQPLPPSFMHANLQGAGTCMLTRTPEGSLAQANACNWGWGDAAWLCPAACFRLHCHPGREAPHSARMMPSSEALPGLQPTHTGRSKRPHSFSPGTRSSIFAHILVHSTCRVCCPRLY